MSADEPDVLARLTEVLEHRRHADPESSYVASLHARGEDAILKKVGEEATEFLLASKSGDASHIVAEAADVWFHMLVLLSHKGLGAADILGELNRREGLSGLDEKAARTDAAPMPPHKPPTRSTPPPGSPENTGVTRP